MIVVRDIFVVNQIFQEVLPPLELLQRYLSEPLKRRPCFRDKTTHTQGNFHAAFQAGNFFCQVGDSRDVLVGLGRQAHHEIQLHRTPTSLERRRTRLKQIFFRHVFVYHVAQTLGACFRGECQPALANGLHFLGKLNRKAVYPQARQGKTHALIAEVSLQVVNQSAKAGIIRAA